jgi:hypothetical protein
LGLGGGSKWAALFCSSISVCTYSGVVRVAGQVPV